MDRIEEILRVIRRGYSEDNPLGREYDLETAQQIAALTRRECQQRIAELLAEIEDMTNVPPSLDLVISRDQWVALKERYGVKDA